MQKRLRTIDPGRQARLEVVVREGLKGNHLLFDAADIAAGALLGDLEIGPDAVFEGAVVLESTRVLLDAAARQSAIVQEVTRTGLALARSASIDEARARVAAASPECRAELARLYLAFLGRCAFAQGPAS